MDKSDFTMVEKFLLPHLSIFKDNDEWLHWIQWTVSEKNSGEERTNKRMNEQPGGRGGGGSTKC